MRFAMFLRFGIVLPSRPKRDGLRRVVRISNALNRHAYRRTGAHWLYHMYDPTRIHSDCDVYSPEEISEHDVHKAPTSSWLSATLQVGLEELRSSSRAAEL